MSLTLPTAAAFQLTKPADLEVTADTTFSWTNATNAANNVVLIGGSNGHPDPAQEVLFFCVAPDTGTFVFPSATRQTLIARNFSGQVTQAGRAAGGVSVHDDMLMLTSVTRLTSSTTATDAERH
ncbi:hypothetical protein [Deinococcus sonorensis]|uniref:Uncharacterized protein n=2 Tax=Deinococcus sonorensis TaxID=309891 RepID=A0AAU7U4F5_9DEIO